MNPNQPHANPGSQRVQPPETRVILVATAVGLSIMGDSLMYGILALEAETLGFSLAAVGWLLSANRWIRLLSNTMASSIFERFGPRLPFIGATVLGFVATLLYGSGWGFTVFLLARMTWGVAWSGLRQGGYEAVLSASSAKKGRLMGVLWGVVRLGSAISVALGGYLRDQYGYQVSVGVIAAITALAIPIAWLTPWQGSDVSTETPPQPTDAAEKERSPASRTGWMSAFQTPLQRWLLLAGLMVGIFDGVVIPTVAVFLSARLDSNETFALGAIGVGTLTGVLLFVRWTANLLFGPLIGWLSDGIGQTATIVLLACTTLIVLVGAISLPGLWPLACLLVMFVTSAGLFVTSTAASSGVAARSERPQQFVGVYTTASDAGAAMGPMLAFNLSDLVGFETLYLSLAVIVLGVVLRYAWLAQKS